MKRFFACFLFQRRPGEGLSRRRTALFWVWNWGLLTGAALLLGLLSLVLATANYPQELFYDYLGSPALLCLNLLPPLLLALLLYGLTGLTWLAYLITAVPVLLLSFGNYYKLVFRDDPVVASDLRILAEVRQMAGRYPLFLSHTMILTLVCAVLSTAVLAVLVRGRPRVRPRLIAAGCLAAVCAALVPLYGSDDVYAGTANEAHINRWSGTQQYLSRGMLYPFLHSVKAAIHHPPEGYSAREAAALLAGYEDADIPEDRRVNIVGIMLESFVDLSVHPQIEFRQDIYALYHALEAESYTGNLMTNIYGGGTVNTERAFLTGINSGDQDYRTATSSYVWYLKSQGYQATGDHPSNDWFYNRKNVNAYLGFDWYRFSEDFYQSVTGGETTAGDRIMLPCLTESIRAQLESDAPLFSFSVTYQGHGPYGDEVCWWGPVDNFVGNEDSLSPALRTALANYLASVQETQEFLVQMVDTFREWDEPIVLVLFGDHQPSIGNTGTVTGWLGIDISQGTREGFYNYWGTRYLIWANDAAKEMLGNDFAGEGPDISPCFLMNLLFDQLGWQGDAYMQAVHDCWQQVPVINPVGRYITADGALCYEDELPEELRETVQRFGWLEYYRQTHFTKGKEGSQ